MKISELITTDDINNWQAGDIITIKAGTGSGKSYFIKNNLYATAKKAKHKILFLIHRTNCINQFQQEINRDKKDDVIKIHTYQYIENLLMNNRQFEFNEYQYIVCDEFHYFLSDAAFNKTTDMSLNAILNIPSAIKVFMSATGEYMKKYLVKRTNKKLIDYELPADFSALNQLSFFNKDSTLDMLIQNIIQKKEKAIFFIQSAKKAHDIYKKYKDVSLFNCSKSNETYYKYVNAKKINSMLRREKFTEQILITTTCLDTGVNIIDKDLKHIICDVKDVGTIIQCIGRKRTINKNDKVNVYIKSMSNQQLGGIETQLKKKIEMARYLRNHSVDEYINKYKRELDHSYIIYDDIENNQLTKKINELSYFKCMVDIAEIEIMKNIGKYGFTKTLAKKLGKGSDYKLMEEELIKISLTEYLESITGKKLYKEEQKILKGIFRINGLEAKTLGINTINGNLKDRGLKFIVEQGKRKSYRDTEGKVKKEGSHWIVGKITY